MSSGSNLSSSYSLTDSADSHFDESYAPTRVTPDRHLLGAQRGGFVRSETGTPHSEPFDESSARIVAESNRYSAISEHLMSSQLGFFVRGDPRTRDTSRSKPEIQR